MNPTGYPCPLCNVRPDVECRHRPADPEWRRAPQDDTPRPRSYIGQGFNFRSKARKGRC